ncbi:hypothetical protein O6H91_01G176300 [Diphasiastrum complanatum]|uniref:Uncharacterized protein n=1 Tax=Diphasiastrum complanatum TaxID=34168 RepID=A0ACC2EZ48_DIPCM|nr:hypothetical protein O6H91_01G176300 [Diphasiastrum complanatum]
MFGPENDYAQVLAEARTHLATNPLPSFARSNSSRKPAGGGSAFHHRYEDAVEGSKSGRSWKNSLFFWRKPKRNTQDSYIKCNSTPLNTTHHTSRKANSGPIYFDGMPSGPSNKHYHRGPRSGPLRGASIISSRKNELESPYVPLHRAPRIPSGPVYVC